MTRPDRHANQSVMKMSVDEIETLSTALSFGRDVSIVELGKALDPDSCAETQREFAYERLRPLIYAGAIRRVYSGLYRLTERGRIAGALLLAKDRCLAVAFFDQ